MITKESHCFSPEAKKKKENNIVHVLHNYIGNEIQDSWYRHHKVSSSTTVWLESILETLWDVYTIQQPGISDMSINYVKASDKKNWWKLKRVNLDLLIDTHGENDNDNDDVNNSNNNNNINNK